jgi:hypothetical protein
MLNNNGSTLHLPLTPRVLWNRNPHSERRVRGNPPTYLPRIQLHKIGYAQGTHSSPRTRRKVHIPAAPPSQVPSPPSITPYTRAHPPARALTPSPLYSGVGLMQVICGLIGWTAAPSFLGAQHRYRQPRAMNACSTLTAISAGWLGKDPLKRADSIRAEGLTHRDSQLKTPRAPVMDHSMKNESYRAARTADFKRQQEQAVLDAAEAERRRTQDDRDTFKEAFRIIDMDNSGSIEPAEVIKVLKTFGQRQVDEAQFWGLFRSIDLDGSRGLDIDEFVTVMEEVTMKQRATQAKQRSTTVSRWKKGVEQVSRRAALGLLKQQARDEKRQREQDLGLTGPQLNQQNGLDGSQWMAEGISQYKQLGNVYGSSQRAQTNKHTHTRVHASAQLCSQAEAPAHAHGCDCLLFCLLLLLLPTTQTLLSALASQVG